MGVLQSDGLGDDIDMEGIMLGSEPFVQTRYISGQTDQVWHVTATS